MAIWAAREVQRHPGRSVLLFACLASLVFLTATPLLFSQALDVTWMHLMDQTPDLVVRRIDAGGWAPIPARAAVALATKVPGALNPTARLWGVVPGPAGPVTVVATDGIIPEKVRHGLKVPSAGQAVVVQEHSCRKGSLSCYCFSLHPLESDQIEIFGTCLCC